MGDIAILIGALVPTYLLSRLLLLGTRRISLSIGGLFLVHFVSGLVCVVAAAFGNSDGEKLGWSSSHIYVGAQLVWLLADWYRRRKAKA